MFLSRVLAVMHAQTGWPAAMHHHLEHAVNSRVAVFAAEREVLARVTTAVQGLLQHDPVLQDEEGLPTMRNMLADLFDEELTAAVATDVASTTLWNELNSELPGPGEGEMPASAEVVAAVNAGAATARLGDGVGGGGSISEAAMLLWSAAREGLYRDVLVRQPVEPGAVDDRGSDVALRAAYSRLVVWLAVPIRRARRNAARRAEQVRQVAEAAKRARDAAEEADRRAKQARTAALPPKYNPGAGMSSRTGFDPTKNYRLIIREHGVDTVAVDDEGVALAHHLGEVPHLGAILGVVTLPRTTEGPNHRAWQAVSASELGDFDDNDPAGGLGAPEA